MSALLVLLSIIGMAGALLFVNQATAGVGIIGAACWLGIMARIAQAHSQHGEIKKLLADWLPREETPTAKED